MKSKCLITISILQGNIQTLAAHLENTLGVQFAVKTDTTLIIDVDKKGCPVSLNELKRAIAEVAGVVIAMGDYYKDGTCVLYSWQEIKSEVAAG